MKYITRIGQKTGISKQSKKVQIIPTMVLFVIAYQNLNSGSLLMNGRNSSFDFVGSSGPCSSARNRFSFIKDIEQHYIYLTKLKALTLTKDP